MLILLHFATIGQCQINPLLLGDSTKNKQQLVALTGTIESTSTHKPLPGAYVHVDGLLKGSTDEFGKYFILLKRGKNRVVFTHVSMTPERYQIEIYEASVLNLEMSEKVFELDEFVVNGQESDYHVKQPISGTESLTISTIRTLPALIGEPDIIKSLQLLPGVTSVGEGTAGVNVRGGRTDQNLMLMNEAIVLSANHALGFLSPFNSDALGSFVLYKGVVPSNYGGRSSSALDIKMRQGDFSQWNFQLSAGSSVSKVLVEGPILKDKVSILVGGRISNTNWLLRKTKNDNVRGSNVSFNDTYTSISAKINSKNFLDVNLLTTGDYFRFSNKFGYTWSTMVTSATLKNLITKNFSVNTLFAYGRLKNSYFDISTQESPEITNTINYSQLKASGILVIGENSLTFGAETVIYKSSPEKIGPHSTTSTIVPNEVQKDSGRELAFFVSDDWSPLPWFSFSAGARYSSFSQLGPDSVFQYDSNKPRLVSNIIDTVIYTKGNIQRYHGFEPRLSVRISLSKTQSIKAGYSKMFQYVHTLSNTTAPTPVDLWQVSTTHIAPQQSENFSLGYFQNLKSDKWSMSLEGFYRLSTHQLEYKDFADLTQNPHIETELLQGLGKAYGVEVQIKKNRGKWTGWLAYTYSRAFSKVNGDFKEEKLNNGTWFPSNHDKPNVAALVLNRKLFPRGSFNLSVTYSTGRPITIIDSYYNVNGAVIPNYSNRNQYRIPDYFRVDVSFEIASIFKKIDDTLVLGVYNFLGRKNAYSVYYERFANQTRLVPYKLSLLGAALPSITYTVKFKGKKR